MVEPLWSPSDERIKQTRLDSYRRQQHPDLANSDDLWQWSVDNPGAFWRQVWDNAGLVGSPGDRLVEEGEQFWQWRFLPDASLNIARNLLEQREESSDPAIIWRREDGAERFLDWEELTAEVAAFAAYLRAAGIKPGDRVAAWMPHVPETIVAFLASASIGAVFTSTSADFGVDGVVDRFGQTEPRVLIAADGYLYGGRSFSCLDRLPEIVERLPSVERVVVVGHLESDPTIPPSLVHTTVGWREACDSHAGVTPDYAELQGDHPVYILYSSGTTGKPKCIVHRGLGVLLKHLAEQQLQCDIRPGDRVFYFTTCGWMMWNWLVSALGSGATILLYEGNPGHPGPQTLFDLIDRYELTLFGVSAKFIDASMKTGLRPIDTHRMEHLRAICSTGSPLSHEGFEWIYDAVKTDVHLASIAGGTDLCGCLVAGDPTKPVYAGAVQRKTFGLDIEVYDDHGDPLPSGEKGELVCTTPFPSMPIEFWNDANGSRYRAAYFERFDGVWAHGDYASWTEEGGMIIHGRSDATLNASGVRIGTAEIYRVVEQLPEVAEAICIGQEWDGDTRIVLFVRLSGDLPLSDQLQKTIRSELRSKCSPRHVPAFIGAVPDIPRTRSGKIVELAVTETVHGRPVKNLEALANPEALTHFELASHPELKS